MRAFRLFLNRLCPDCAGKLDLHRHNIVSIPNEVWGLKELKEFDLSDNANLTTVPSDVSKLRGLQSLDLSGTKVAL
jgi:Leucine-rich repeat (LRR) protein